MRRRKIERIYIKFYILDGSHCTKIIFYLHATLEMIKANANKL